jgi:hypothetical protein
MKLLLKLQINGGKKYYYPKNDEAATLCKLMHRRALIPTDFPILAALNFNAYDISEPEVDLCASTASQQAS